MLEVIYQESSEGIKKVRQQFYSEARRIKKKLKEEGLIAFISEVLILPLNFMIFTIDRCLTKTLAPFYVTGFHKLYYYSSLTTWNNTYWLGVPAQKCPLDMWVYQEIIWQTKPDFIIETGTARGGSASFFASIVDLIGKGQVITIDIADRATLTHPRIIKIVGDSVSQEVVSRVKNIVGGKSCMVSLDSDHAKNHVLKELYAYSELVSLGNYLVIEDTNLRHPAYPRLGRKGPMEAMEEFLSEGRDFVIDRTREKFLLTFCPRGFLKRVQRS